MLPSASSWLPEPGVHIEIMTGKRKLFFLNEKSNLLKHHDKLPKWANEMQQWNLVSSGYHVLYFIYVMQ